MAARVIALDAMGGDRGPAAVVAGIAKSAEKNPDVAFIVHGPASELKPLIEKRGLSSRCQIRDVSEIVTMDAKPSHVMRNGKGTSMWSAIESVRNGEAEVAVSCGNTGALMALSMIRLRKLPGKPVPILGSLRWERIEEALLGAELQLDTQTWFYLAQAARGHEVA